MNSLLKPILISSLLAAGSVSAAETIGFDKDPVGSAPLGWVTGGQGGSGKAVWSVEADASAPSAPNVLKQSGSADFGWCVKKGTSIADGAVEVKFKSLSGKRARAGGVIFRFKGPESYYVARANAKEHNVNLYLFDGGRRQEVIVVKSLVAHKQWHTLRAEFQGKHIKVIMDGKTMIDLEDDQISGPGAVGVWTRFDSNTLFDDFKV
jgi:hypothetical protein